MNVCSCAQLPLSEKLKPSFFARPALPARVLFVHRLLAAPVGVTVRPALAPRELHPEGGVAALDLSPVRAPACGPGPQSTVPACATMRAQPPGPPGVTRQREHTRMKNSWRETYFQSQPETQNTKQKKRWPEASGARRPTRRCGTARKGCSPQPSCLAARTWVCASRAYEFTRARKHPAHARALVLKAPVEHLSTLQQHQTSGMRF